MTPAPVEAKHIMVEPRPHREPELIDVPNPYEEDVDVQDYPAVAGFFSLGGLL